MPATAPPTFRFAPSPNGYLHIGHAYSALFTWQAAQRAQGRFLLRIEDIDLHRRRPHFVSAIFEDLAWLGLRWEEPVRHQSRHFADYARALQHLRELDLVYPCFASRAEIAAAAGTARDPDGAPLYPGLWKQRPPGDVAARLRDNAPYAWRLHMDRAMALAWTRSGRALTFTEEAEGPAGETGEVTVDAARWGDVVIARKDVPASYHLAVVVDDALQGVSHVTRGQDLFHATHIHRLLQAVLDLPVPRYRHHGLARDAGGRKLAKSAGDISLRALRAQGETPAAIRAKVGI